MLVLYVPQKKNCQFCLCAGNLFCIDSVRVWVHFIEFCIQVSQVLKHKKIVQVLCQQHTAVMRTVMLTQFSLHV